MQNKIIINSLEDFIGAGSKCPRCNKSIIRSHYVAISSKDNNRSYFCINEICDFYINNEGYAFSVDLFGIECYFEENKSFIITDNDNIFVCIKVLISPNITKEELEKLMVLL